MTGTQMRRNRWHFGEKEGGESLIQLKLISKVNHEFNGHNAKCYIRFYLI